MTIRSSSVLLKHCSKNKFFYLKKFTFDDLKKDRRASKRECKNDLINIFVFFWFNVHLKLLINFLIKKEKQLDQ